MKERLEQFIFDALMVIVAIGIMFDLLFIDPRRKQSHYGPQFLD